MCVLDAHGKVKRFNIYVGTIYIYDDQVNSANIFTIVNSKEQRVYVHSLLLFYLFR